MLAIVDDTIYINILQNIKLLKTYFDHQNGL